MKGIFACALGLAPPGLRSAGFLLAQSVEKSSLVQVRGSEYHLSQPRSCRDDFETHDQQQS
jgi:hypothetical protein